MASTFFLHAQKEGTKKKGTRMPCPQNKDLGLPELLTIANAPFKFASLLS
jgi:hypothetical protein